MPFYGFAVMCTDHPVVQEMVGLVRDRRVITYGPTRRPMCGWSISRSSTAQSHFAVEIRDRIRMTHLRIEGLTLPMPGEHNALNATAAIAVADQLKVPAEAIRKGLAGFSGVKRRFTKTGIVGGVTVIDDYGHHPVEIAAVLKAARQSTQARRHRRGAAAPLIAPPRSVQRFRHRLQRRRHRHRRAGLCGRRAADRGRDA